MTKTVLKNFHYKEADDFAAYLHDMSLKGWHFSEWRLGLVFEKGEPENITYSVEVFQKGSEMDTRPEPDTEEFAEYCEAAGWKFLDSKRKFCIFRKKSEDAVPIVTPEERFENIKNAEWRCWREYFISCVLITGLYWGQFLTVSFESWIFSNLFLVCLGIVTLLFAVRALQAVSLVIWSRKRKKHLLENREVYYGHENNNSVRMQSLRMAVPVLLALVILAAAIAERMYQAAVFCAAVFLMFGVICIWIGSARPSRGENQMIQIGTGIAVPIVSAVIILMIIIGGFMDSSGSQPDAEGLLDSRAPLLQEDFKEKSGKITYIDEGKQKSFMGEMGYYYVKYAEEGSETPDDIQYEIYESTHSWILDMIWKNKLKGRDNPEDCTAVWGTEQALVDRSDLNRYYVRGKNKLFTLATGEELNGQQIQVIKEKIGMEDTGIS